MDKENGDEYIRRAATFVRTHEQHLADAVTTSKRRPQRHLTGSSSVLGWIGLGAAEHPRKRLLFTEDPHHLFYLLMRFESLGIDVGSLDVRVQNPSRPTSMSYLAMLATQDNSDVLSISSLRSTMSSVSMFSLGGGWFGRAEPTNVNAELKYLYSAFTKLPALRVRASGLKLISELASDPPTDSAIPMDAFKNLQLLECHDIDPRTLMGWDRLSEGLRSLTVKRSGLEDVTDLFLDSVIDDRLRREGSPARVTRPRLVHRPPSVRSRQPSFHAAQLPASVPEDSEQAGGSPHERCLPPYAWSLLTHLSLSDNTLTFLPFLPPLPSLSSLDLSSNLLISIPPSLSTLTALKSLNLAHNMVDSVLGIYSQIPFIVSLNVSANRLDSLCGLERLGHLSRVDLRDNRVEDTDEIGRLAVLADMKEVWVSGNPCTRRDQEWRVRCFDLFAKESREIFLDGTSPGLMERRAMIYHLDKNGHVHGSNGRPLSQTRSPSNSHANGSSTPSPQVVAARHSPPSGSVRASPALSTVQSIVSVPGPGQQPKARRRKNKRIVDLDDKESTDESSREAPYRRTHVRHASDVSILRQGAHPTEDTPGPSNASMTNSTKDPSDPNSLGAVDIPSSTTIDGSPSQESPSISESPTTISRIRQNVGSARTLSSAKSSKRRARLSPSMYEPGSVSQTPPERGHDREQTIGTSSGKFAAGDAEVFRKRIEALRNEVGDSWLKVLNQTRLGSPDHAALRHKT